MEQWNAYGALWIQQEQEKSATQPNIEATAPVVDSGYTPSTGPVPTTGPPIASPTPTTGPPIASPTPTTGPPVAGPVPTTSPPMSRPTFVSPEPAPITPVLNSNWNPSHQEIKRGKKGLVIGGSTIAILLVTILILAVLPPGNLSLMDENRDRDSDGLTDAEELVLGTNPERSDTDGDGLQDNEEDCPNGDSDWTASTATDYDGDGCKDNSEDPDDDNDGILDGDDDCRKSSSPNMPFTSTQSNDMDRDGCRDSDEDDDDDNDGWSDQDERDCDSNPNNANSVPDDLDADMICDSEDADIDGDGVNNYLDAFPYDITQWADSDGDGYGDNPNGNNGDAFPYESSQWSDIDGDGYGDNQAGWSPDAFPYDPSEWVDFDGDGIGDNADTDDDNDGVLDIYDVNDYADTGVLLTLDTFRVDDKMDYWDNDAEIYLCVYLEGGDVEVGCSPGGGLIWRLDTGTLYSLGEEFFIDLPETTRNHEFKISVWDHDTTTAPDRMDINPLSTWDSYTFNYDSITGTIDKSTFASGAGDGNGDDASLWFSIEEKDLRLQRFSTFSWEYDDDFYSISIELDYQTYADAKNSHPTTHTGCMGVDCSIYADPDAQYVIDLANDLKALAIRNGLTSSYEIAEFIYAFVGTIQYQFDIDGVGQNEFPKYPIEMLWEAAGDCEDAAILYVSLVEAIGYDAILVRLLVKQDSDDDWGGHFMAGIDVNGGSGSYFYYDNGPKSGIDYWVVEATGWNDGSSSIGNHPWYDWTDFTLYDIEES